MIQPTQIDLIIKNAGELLTLSPSFKEESGLGMIQNGAVAVEKGRILWVGKAEELSKKFFLNRDGREIDATGKVVMPGLIDAHTHLVFAGSRENEFEQRIQGLSYQEIAGRGGGILSTVEATRNSSFDQLLSLGKKRLDRMLSKGVTTVEAKSGYGLSLQDEIKILKVMKALQESHPIDIVPTFLGAHTLPREFREDRAHYMGLLTEEMIPKVAQERLAEFCDVFCEEKAFTLEESKQILETGKRYGLKPKIHADQLSSGGGAELAAEVNAYSADHLEYASPEGIKKMAEKGVTAVLLPGASFFLSMKKYPAARDMIEQGVVVALATDLNPGSSMTESLPLMMTMGCTMFKMIPKEVIQAATIHAARSMGREKEIGSLEVGKQADILVLDIPNYRYLPYHFGVDHVEYVVKKGKVVYHRQWSLEIGKILNSKHEMPAP
ncbi:MAG: imidazolonepropionase [Deltaproteobacteria bacterium RBG_16_47_11]|nr:MAG: imidazolonepropionase [Deltaproteobacteria bacterium RBG_16_47_11]